MTHWMIAIVLAGGYAKRLWPLTLDTPKALLPVAGKPVIDHIIEKLDSLSPPLSRIVLSTNLRFQPQFQEWMATRTYHGVELVPDDSSSEEQKPGAVKAMADIAEDAGEEDALIVAGDGMFNDDLVGFLRYFREKAAPVVALYRVKSIEEAKRCATIAVGEAGRIVEFAEKPANPKTTLVCGCVYAFPRGIGRRFKEYLGLGLPTDQPGRFVEWLCRQEPVYGYMLKDHLWDIGTLESYKACDKFFSKCSNVKLREEVKEVKTT